MKPDIILYHPQQVADKSWMNILDLETPNMSTSEIEAYKKNIVYELLYPNLRPEKIDAALQTKTGAPIVTPKRVLQGEQAGYSTCSEEEKNSTRVWRSSNFTRAGEQL
jgi:hypothetical protein